MWLGSFESERASKKAKTEPTNERTNKHKGSERGSLVWPSQAKPNIVSHKETAQDS